MANRIQLRRGTAAQWTAANPVLAQGEPGIETDTGKQKFGNGVAAWSALPYASVGPAGPAGVASDSSVKDLITTPGTETAAALSATIGTQVATAITPKLDTTIADFNFLDVRKTFAGVGLYSMGNSWLEFVNYGAQQYANRLVAKLGFTGITNRAKSGARMQDTAVYIIQEGARKWTAGTKGVLVVGDLLNNLIETDNATNRAAALEGCRAVVAAACASSRVEQVGWTFGPGWNATASAQTYASGGSVAIAYADAYVDLPVPAGVSYLLCHGTDGTTFLGGQVTAIKDAATVGVKDLNATTIKTGNVANNGLSPVVLRMENATAGTLRISTQQLGRTNAVSFVDALLPQSTTPPLIVLVKPVYVPAGTHDKPALLTYLRTVPDTVKAEFGDNVLVIDPSVGWNAATMLGADLLHPNEAGQEHIANTITTAIKAELLRRTAKAAFGTLV